MQTKNIISNEKNAQVNAFIKDWNEGDEEGIDVSGLAHVLEPNIYTDFILKSKLLQLFPSTEKVNVSMRDESKKHEAISLKAPIALEECEGKKEQKEL